MRRILHATEFSTASEAAFKKAVELAKQSRAELVVLHVMSPVVYTVGEGYMSPKMYDELAASTRAWANGQLGRQLRKAKASGVRARGLLLEGLTREESMPVVHALKKRPDAWRDFMMRFELGLEPPDPSRARRSALVIAGAYVAGGIVPLLPYMAVTRASSALPWSVAVTLLALGVFGWIKGRFTGAPRGRSALQTVLIGGLAAGAAFLIAR